MISQARLFFLPLSLLASVAIAMPAAAGTSPPTPPGHAPAEKKPLPKPSGKPPAISLASRVETLGSTRFQSAYGGQETSPSGRLVVLYVVRAHAAAFLQAVRDQAAHSGGAGYRVAYVPHSFAQLDALTMKIARQEPRWRARGIGLAKWGPDAASSKVVIQLRSYTPAAGRKLLAAYGAGWVFVSRKSLKLRGYLADRYNDTKPFYGGDRIFDKAEDTGTYCTDAFTMLGNNNPSNHWAITAGHCGSRTWYTNFTTEQELGPTATNYFSGFGGSTYTDTQTIGVGDTNAVGVVWGDDGTTYLPYTTLHPGNGANICFDGATTKLVCDVAVTDAGPFCATLAGYEECKLGEAHDPDRVICSGGDSGGPVFERTSNDNYIEAVGTITGGADSGHTCFYTLMDVSGGIEDTTNTHLDTSSSG